MRFWNSTAFRVWVMFGLIGLSISVPLSYYFNEQQKEILLNNTKEEFDNNAAIAAKVIKQAIMKEDFHLLEVYMANIDKYSDFEYIAIIENDKVFACYPKEFANKALRIDNGLIYSESNFFTELISGKIVITTSKEKDEILLSKLQEPFFYLIIISILSSIMLFALSLRYLTAPIFKAIGIAKELGKQNYDIEIKPSKSKNEIAALLNSLFSLKQNLVDLKNENESYKTNLEDQIKLITKEIKDKNEELIALNKNLEEKVIEKTKVNIEMSNSLIAQEKLVMLGEVSSGIAHDLNTPLGSIKASNESLNELIRQINLQSANISEIEINLINNVLSEPVLPNPFEKNKWVREQTDQIRQLMTQNQLTTQIELASSIASTGIDSTKTELIKNFCDQPDPMKTIGILKNYLIIFTLLKGIGQAVDKSSLVVSNLNKFIKQDINREKTPIILLNSLQVLEPLFKFRLKKDYELSINVSDKHVVLGHETELFQVWTNLLKNALDAFEMDQTHHVETKNISIYSEKEGANITIHFENNGPEIPEDVKDKILKKYFTTKKENGTGLGLSIVSKIVAEHYGKITFTSVKERTVFSVTLPAAN